MDGTAPEHDTRLDPPYDWSPSAVIDSGLGEEHTTRRCRRVTYPESFITEYTTYTKIQTVKTLTKVKTFKTLTTVDTVDRFRVKRMSKSQTPRVVHHQEYNV